MEDALPWICSGMMLAGIAMLSVAIYKVGKLLKRLPNRHLKSRWQMMRLLILMFILGYVGFTAQLWDRVLGWNHLLEPTVFFGGAIFVLLVCNVSLATTQTVQEIYSLKRDVITDPLMGIFNRRHLEQRLAEEIAACRATRQPLALMMLDIDYFKGINDTYGHLAGDEVLRTLGQMLLRHTRNADIVARFGGEEIAVLLPATSGDEAKALALRLHEETSKIRVPLPESHGTQRATLSFAVSIGVAGCNGDNADATDLMRAADLALYQAKEQGRNQVACCPDLRLTIAA